VLARNVRVGRNEIDLIIDDRGTVCAVEVKFGASALDHFDDDKRARVAGAMRRLQPPARRLDLITIVPTDEAVTIRWWRGV